MTKSYEQGIIDAYNIVDKWSNIGIHPSIINTIKLQLLHLLPPEHEFLKNKITNKPKKSQELYND